jgi:sugar phosphate isomerase/epimerase
MSWVLHRLSVTASTLSSDPREAIASARALGFGGVLLDAFSAGLDITSLSATGRREFRHLLSSSDQHLVGVRVDLGTRGFGPGADVDRLLGRLDQVLEAAVGIGADLTCVDLGPLPAPAKVAKPKPKVTPEMAGLILLPSLGSDPAAALEPATEADPGPLPDPAFISHFDSALLELGQRADRYNAMVALSSSLSGFAALDRALVAARCPWFGVDLDPVATLRDPWPLDEIMSRLANQIRHVRAKDAIAGDQGRTKPAVIARGDVKWRDLLAALEQAGYSGWLSVDPIELPDRRTAAIAGLKQLKAYAE